MTSPGFPDFQAYPQWRAVPIASGTAHAVVGTPFTVQGYVTNWQALNLVATLLSTPGVTITATYYTDATLAVQIAFFSWVLGVSGGRVAVTIPNAGNFVQIQVTTVEAGTKTITWVVGAVNIPVARAEYQVSNNNVSQLSISIGAGVTATFQMPDVVAGQGYYEVVQFLGTTGFNVLVQQLLESGAVYANVVENTGVTKEAHGNFLLSEYVTQIAVTNNDAAARFFDIWLTAIGL